MMPADRLILVPVTLAEANRFVEAHHRHHRPVVGHKFSIAARFGTKIVRDYPLNIRTPPESESRVCGSESSKKAFLVLLSMHCASGHGRGLQAEGPSCSGS